MNSLDAERHGRAERRYLLEQIGEAAVVQVYADGFDALPLDQKILMWHLSQAAIAGRDIYYDQRYRFSLEMRGILEDILTHGDRVEPRVLAEVRRYAKLFWINSGPHNNLTARKFVLMCTADELRAAIAAATPATEAGSRRSPLSAAILSAFLDPAFDPIVTNKTPGAGRDILSASANNLYDGVTSADLDGFDERHGLNSRLVKSDGRLVEEVCRVGGKYDAEIRRIVAHLRNALPYAPAATRTSLEKLIRWYETGEEADRKAYDVSWVADKDAPVDTINGFVETYMDARGVKGAWEAIVFFVNPAKTIGMANLAAAAPWFETRMPWDSKWRRADVTGVTARAIDVVMETGDAGPCTPIGINLPNDQTIREVHGSKSVQLANITEAYDKSLPTSYRREFSWTDEEVERAEKWSALAGEVTTAIHEVLGHGSGRVAEHLHGQPQLVLKEQYSALEESRADLVALYWLPDPKIAELGLVPAEHQAEIVLAEYESYTRNALVQLRRVREGAQIEEDHMRNRQAIIHWLMANTRAIDVRTREGKTFYVMTNATAFHDGVGTLLAEVQRIKSEGDYQAARDLFERHGVHFDPALRDEVVARVDRLNLPSYTGFVQPRLDAVRDASGALVDVRIFYPCDIERQMLEFSGKLQPMETSA